MLPETTPHVSTPAGSSGTATIRASRRLYADISALDRALVLSDLAAARAAFDRLQEDSPLIADAVSHDPFPVKTRPLRALKTLGRCLLSGDLPRARRAFESFC